MYDAMKPHCLPCPYKPPLEREKLPKELFVDDGKRYMATWSDHGKAIREVSKEEFERELESMLRPDPMVQYRRPAWETDLSKWWR